MLLYLVIGLVFIVSVEALKLSTQLSSVFILIAFIGLNLIFSYTLKLKTELYEFWSLKKVWLILSGTLAGLTIALFPLFSGLVVLNLSASEIIIFKAFSFSAIVTTFMIVSWEELWFRGLVVSYCNRFISATRLSLVVGFLFAVLHVLNPKIDLLRSGPALFFAGALLTIVYLHFQSIWLPIGLHFGNNYANSIFSSELNNHLWFGNDGYLSALLLAVLFMVFAKLQQKRNSERTKPLTQPGN